MYISHNQQRAQNGLASFQLDPTLVAIARQRAQDMAAKAYFSHTSPSGETAFSLMNAAGYDYSLAGENIARNNYADGQTVSVAMTGFMGSSAHRANILNGGFRRIGIGMALGNDGMRYFAVVFSD